MSNRICTVWLERAPHPKLYLPAGTRILNEPAQHLPTHCGATHLVLRRAGRQRVALRRHGVDLGSLGVPAGVSVGNQLPRGVRSPQPLPQHGVRAGAHDGQWLRLVEDPSQRAGKPALAAVAQCFGRGLHGVLAILVRRSGQPVLSHVLLRPVAVRLAVHVALPGHFLDHHGGGYLRGRVPGGRRRRGPGTAGGKDPVLPAAGPLRGGAVGQHGHQVRTNAEDTGGGSGGGVEPAAHRDVADDTRHHRPVGVLAGLGSRPGHRDVGGLQPCTDRQAGGHEPAVPVDDVGVAPPHRRRADFRRGNP